jgi:uncharacterized RDD family membrane protein YckC
MMTFCPRCGRQNDSLARSCQTCGNELRKIGPVSVPLFYAGFWKRFAAVVVDVIVVGLAEGVLSMLVFGAGGLAFVFLPWVYEAVMLSSERQATIGKILLGIVVTDIEGQRISFVRATGRHFAKYLSALLLGIGFLMAAFTRRKQALHDLVADTLVVNK